VATTPPAAWPVMAAYALLPLTGIALAGLPLAGVLWRAAVVLPFAVTFALVSVLAGDLPRGLALVAKSYLSACAVVFMMATTPLPQLLRALENLRVPRLLVLVAQFLYRYLFVLTDQAQRMRWAAESRGGFRGGPRLSRARRRSRFGAAAGAVAVLFGRSYARAEAIHHAMLARGFQGSLPVAAAPRWQSGDLLLVLAATAFLLTVRVGAARWIH